MAAGRTVKEVAAELACDWHTVNDAVTTYGEALLAADRKRLNQTTAIGLDETSFFRRDKRRTDYATTVADVEHHQIIDIVPTRYADVATWIDQPAEPGRSGSLRRPRHVRPYAAVYSVMLPEAAQVVDPFHVVRWPTALDATRRRVQVRLGHRGRKTTRSIAPGACCSWAKRS